MAKRNLVNSNNQNQNSNVVNGDFQKADGWLRIRLTHNGKEFSFTKKSADIPLYADVKVSESMMNKALEYEEETGEQYKFEFTGTIHFPRDPDDIEVPFE